MKILVTGFDPFGGEKVNPALEAVKSLPSEIHGAEIHWVEIPTVFYQSAEVLENSKSSTISQMRCFALDKQEEELV